MTKPKIAVRWESPKHKRATPSADAVLRDANRIVNDVWNRLPVSAQLVMCTNGRPPTVWLHHATWAQALADGGTRHDGLKMGSANADWVRLNTDSFKRNRQGKLAFAWVVAHEFAHSYWKNLFYLATSGFLQARRDGAEGDTAGKDSALSYPNSCQSNRGRSQERFLKIEERLADAVTIAWGFGVEYAEAVVTVGVDGNDVEIAEPDCLKADIVRIHEIMQEREDREAAAPC